jgi:4-carboxymuconolactone decarboxylase
MAYPGLPSGQLLRRLLHPHGLDLKTRELLTFVFLISLGGCEPQVKAHVTGNLKIGNDRERLIEVVTQLLPYIGYPRSLNALRMIDEIVPFVDTVLSQPAS